MKTKMKIKMERDIKDRVQFFQSAGQKMKMKSGNENKGQSKRKALIEGQTDRQTDRYRQIDRQIGMQTYRQKQKKQMTGYIKRQNNKLLNRS